MQNYCVRSGQLLAISFIRARVKISGVFHLNRDNQHLAGKWAASTGRVYGVHINLMCNCLEPEIVLFHIASISYCLPD